MCYQTEVEYITTCIYIVFYLLILVCLDPIFWASFQVFQSFEIRFLAYSRYQ